MPMNTATSIVHLKPVVRFREFPYGTIKPAGLIHFIEKYNVRVPAEFVQHAAEKNWRVDQDAVPRCDYDFSYSPADQARSAADENSVSSEAR
jgi:hypothetical protein